MSFKDIVNERKKKRFRKKYKIGLCLSGGGTKGFSYIGCFKAFEEMGIVFDAVAGTSAGSLFGAIYATKIPVKKMMKLFENVKNRDFRKPKISLLPSKMDKFQEGIRAGLPIKYIEDLKVKYYAVAVDLKTGKEVHFSHGEIASVVAGSCAIPGVFYPVKYKNMNLIDGGVLNNIPVNVLKMNGCDFVVTIDCNSSRGGGTISRNIITQFTTSVGIMMVNNSKQGLDLSDIIIRPNLQKFNSLDIAGKDDMIKEGYRATMEMMPEIQKLLLGKYKKR